MIVTLPNTIPLEELIEFARKQGCEVMRLRNGHLQFVESVDARPRAEGLPKAKGAA